MKAMRKKMHKTTAARTQVYDPPAQRHHVRTPAELAQARAEPLAAALYPARIGHFARARGHFVRRPGRLEPLVIVCLEGAGWVTQGRRRTPLRAGEAVWVDCARPHAYGASVEEPWTIAWVHLGGSQVRRWRQRLVGAAATDTWRVPDLAGVEQAFERLWERLQEGADPVAVSVACASWLCALDPRRGAARRVEAPVDRIARSLRDHPLQPVSLAGLAQAAGLSPSHLLSRFRQRWGCPPIQYQIRQRLQRACGLLETTTLKVAAVAAEAGYANPFYFSRLFKQHMGVHPSAYRARFQSRGGDGAART